MRKVLTIVAILLAGCGSTGPITPAKVSIDKLIELHNKARSGSFRSLKPLSKNEKLSKYAQDHAEWMASHGRMTHSSMSSVMRLGFSTAGENIAWGQPTEEAVMSAWLWSPGHRWNIMGSSYTAIGCGAAERDGRIYWCVNFGRPR